MSAHSISFALPMYNESANIGETVRRVTALARELSAEYEIVVADDASTDGSAKVVEGLAAADPHVKLVRLTSNTRFGGALAAALAAATKEIVIYTDSDLPVKDDDVRKALALIADADIVTGYSLVIKDSSLKRIVMSKTYNFLVELLFGLSIRDINSGFKIYRRSILQGMKLRSQSPFIDVEIFAEAARRGARIVQYGLIFDLRMKGRSMIARASVVFRTFCDMIVYRFGRTGV